MFNDEPDSNQIVMVDIVFDPENKSRYLANTSGADNYIRMWTGIEYD